MASLIHIIPDIHIRGKILTSSSPVANTPLCFRLIIKLEKWEYKACFVFVFFIFLPEVKRPLLQKSTIIVNCLYITPQQTTNTCLNKQNIALNLSLCLHQELVCFFFLSQCRLFILKLQMPSQGYSKLQAMLNLSSLCKKKERKNLSVKKSAIATFCDISKWGWTAAVSLQDYRWSVKAARCFVCSSVSLRNSICSLASSQSAALCTHTHMHSLCSMPSPALLFIYTFPDTVHLNLEATQSYLGTGVF